MLFIFWAQTYEERVGPKSNKGCRDKTDFVEIDVPE